MKCRAVTAYLLQDRSTNTKTSVDTRTVKAGLGPSYPLHCVHHGNSEITKNQMRGRQTLHKKPKDYSTKTKVY